MSTVFLFACFYGATFLLTQSKILRAPRLFVAKIMFFRELLMCPFCTGVHVGWVLYLAFNPFSEWNVRLFIAWALSSASVSYIADTIVEHFELLNGRLRDKLGG